MNTDLKRVFEIQNKSWSNFSIKKMVEHARRISSTTALVEIKDLLNDNNDRKMFGIALDTLYGGGYKDTECRRTVYFEINDEDKIVGGVYNVDSDKKLSRITLMAPYLPAKYIASRERIAEYKKIIIGS